MLAARTGAFAARLGSECAPRAVWQRHRLFAIALVLALIPRILAALAIRPAQMTSDSFLYMREAVTGKLSDTAATYALIKLIPSGLGGSLALNGLFAARSGDHLGAFVVRGGPVSVGVRVDPQGTHVHFFGLSGWLEGEEETVAERFGRPPSRRPPAR